MKVKVFEAHTGNALEKQLGAFLKESINLKVHGVVQSQSNTTNIIIYTLLYSEGPEQDPGGE